MGGLRIYSDDPMKTGTHLEIDLLLPDGSSVTCLVAVAWSNPIPSREPAAFDIGLQFLQVPEGALDRMSDVLDYEG